MPRQALRLTKEAVPGTYPTTPLPADVTNIRLVGDDGFPERPAPNLFTIRDYSGSNRPVQVCLGTYKASGRFNTVLYPSQSKLILPWGCNLIAAGGTFKPPYTFTMDHVLTMEDTGATQVYARYLGCYCREMDIRASNTGDGIRFNLGVQFDFMGFNDTITATDFPDTTLASYPTDCPYVLPHLAGNVTIGTARTGFRTAQIMVRNILDQIYDESRWPLAVKWSGRDVSLRTEMRYTSNQDRTDFFAATAKTTTVAMTDGTTTATFDFKTKGILTGANDILTLNRAFYQGLELTGVVDPASTDLVVTIAP